MWIILPGLRALVYASREQRLPHSVALLLRYTGLPSSKTVPILCSPGPGEPVQTILLIPDVLGCKQLL